MEIFSFVLPYCKQLEEEFCVFKKSIDKVKLHEISPLIFDKIQVLISGKKFSLKKLVTFIKIDMKVLHINVFDKTNLKYILNAVENTLKNFSFIVKDENTIICRAPLITTEYKKSILKLVNEHFESLKVKFRCIRNALKKKIKITSYISKDDEKKFLGQFQSKLEVYNDLAKDFLVKKGV
jgi:ribosome recycling factor